MNKKLQIALVVVGIVILAGLVAKAGQYAQETQFQKRSTAAFLELRDRLDPYQNGEGIDKPWLLLDMCRTVERVQCRYEEGSKDLPQHTSTIHAAYVGNEGQRATVKFDIVRRPQLVMREIVF